jgi:hypothetical protein
MKSSCRCHLVAVILNVDSQDCPLGNYSGLVVGTDLRLCFFDSLKENLFHFDCLVDFKSNNKYILQLILFYLR